MNSSKIIKQTKYVKSDEPKQVKIVKADSNCCNKPTKSKIKSTNNWLTQKKPVFFSSSGPKKKQFKQNSSKNIQLTDSCIQIASICSDAMSKSKNF